MNKDVSRIIEDYASRGEVSIATLSSHSSLQILHGAKKEGFKTLLVTLASREWFYRQFDHIVDKFIVVNGWKELCTGKVLEELRRENAVMVPHGSLIEYVGLECAENIPVPYFGNRYLFRVENDQRLKMQYLVESGIKTPRIYKYGGEIDKLVIVKLPGAKGGKGYFLSRSSTHIKEKLEQMAKEGAIKSVDDVIIQEYVIGTPAYFHYFYSPVLNRVEVLGADIRYESNVDGLRRVPLKYLAEDVEPSFVVTGNLPLVVRESLLPTILEYGIKFVEYTRKQSPPGAIGPFCLESVVRDDLEIVVFEFSGRIVAGTNLYVSGSPYSYLYWDEPMSVGRRIARELKLALKAASLEKVLT
ncbi:MAG: formate--phosphoribosylaminoimidazolecarboxamide ligase [Desulfurococcaceae archaeon]